MSRPNKPRTINAEANIAERVAYERVLRGWSYETLARKMTEAGCSIHGSAIFKIEKGEPRRRVTVDELIGMARAFGISIEALTYASNAEEELLAQLAYAESEVVATKAALAAWRAER